MKAMSFSLALVSCFVHHFGMVDESKYYNTHQPRPAKANQFVNQSSESGVNSIIFALFIQS